MTAISTETLYRNFLKRTGFEEKPFQLTCFKWCWQRETAPSSPAGGILSLEMGLGKTLMMLALMESNFKRRTLIVLPCALLDQWEKIIIRTFGYQPLVYHGSRPQNKKLTLEDIMTYPIVLTSYGQVSQPSEKQEDRGRRRSLLCSIQWDRLICDEAHNVSHRTTNDYKGLSEVKAQIIWLVTGTPLQNSRYELATLFILLGLPKPKPSEMTKEIETYMFYLTKAAAGIQLPALEENTTAVAWENRTEKKLSANIHSYLSFCNVSRENRVDAAPATADAPPDAPSLPPLPPPSWI